MITPVGARGHEPPLPLPRPCDTNPLDVIEAGAARKHCRRGQKIYSAGDPTDHWYRVVAGMVGICAPLADGRRRMLDLMSPGSFFGFSPRGTHGFDVEAVVADTIVARYPRRSVDALIASDPILGRRLLDMAFESIQHLQARVLSLGGMTAQQRVGSFLIDMARHSPEGSGDIAILAMSRYDIGDYLGLSAETVSRTLTELKHKGAIALANARKVKILDRAALGAGVRSGGGRTAAELQREE